MTLGKLVIKFPESRGRICGSPEGVSPRDFYKSSRDVMVLVCHVMVLVCNTMIDEEI